MVRSPLFVLAVTAAIFHAGSAHAETRGALRLGAMSLQLESSAETPLFGDQVERAVDRYNAAAAAYDRASGAMTERIDPSDLGVAETLFMIAPGLEIGAGGRYFFRLEAPIGLSSDLRSLGVGIYPLNLQAKLHRRVAGYVSAGATASWLDRPGPGDVGGLVTVRAAAGVRFASRFVAELGYGAFAIGGTVNNERLENMTIADLDAEPEDVLSAGEARGLIDLSLGVTF